MDAVIPSDGNDTFLLQSTVDLIRANTEIERIYILGPARVMQGAEHVDCDDSFVYNKVGNTIKKYLKACGDRRISDPFLAVSDDLLFLRPCREFPFYHRGSLQNVVPSRNYNKSLVETYKVLRAAGLPFFNYETHAPRVIHKKHYRDAIARFANLKDDISTAPQGMSLYCNYIDQLKGVEPVRHADFKIRDESRILDIIQQRSCAYLSVPRVCTSRVRAAIQNVRSEYATQTNRTSSDISVIIPAYRAVDTIHRTLSSLACQIVYPREVMVGVDGCADTLDAIKASVPEALHSLIRVFWFDQRKGPYVIRNTLVKKSRGSHIVFFDADDEMLPDHLEYMHRHTPPGTLIMPRAYRSRLSKHNSYYNAHGIISIHKQDIFNMCGFEPWLCAADTEFLQRAAQGGMEIIRPEHVTVVIHETPNSLTSDPSTGMMSEYRLHYRKIIEARKVTPVRLPKMSTVRCRELELDLESAPIPEPSSMRVATAKRKSGHSIFRPDPGRTLRPTVSKLCERANKLHYATLGGAHAAPAKSSARVRRIPSSVVLN